MIQAPYSMLKLKREKKKESASPETPIAEGETNPTGQTTSTSDSLPYRPLPPIRTVPDPPRITQSSQPAVSEEQQIANLRKVIALQFNPMIAHFLSDEDVLWYRDQIQLLVERGERDI